MHILRINFGAWQRYRPSPCFVGAGPTFALGHPFVEPFWLRVGGWLRVLALPAASSLALPSPFTRRGWMLLAGRHAVRHGVETLPLGHKLCRNA